jgi:hypothetical protein
MTSILDAIGNTPLVRLATIVPENGAELWVKLEYLNPLGSMKDRIALAMVEGADGTVSLRPATPSSSTRAAAPARRSRSSATRRAAGRSSSWPTASARSASSSFARSAPRWTSSHR